MILKILWEKWQNSFQTLHLKKNINIVIFHLWDKERILDPNLNLMDPDPQHCLRRRGVKWQIMGISGIMWKFNEYLIKMIMWLIRPLWQTWRIYREGKRAQRERKKQRVTVRETDKDIYRHSETQRKEKQKRRQRQNKREREFVMSLWERKWKDRK